VADVRRPPTRPRRQRARGSGRHRGAAPCPDDRGQLFLVGALSLAVLFVGFALLLNTAIYTENLATRNTDPGTDPSISYRAAAEDAARGILVRENRNGMDPTPSDKTQWFEAGIEEWSDSAGLHAARRARVASITVSSTTGTRFQQTNASRDFTDKQGSPDWTLGVDPEHGAVRDAHLYVRRDSLPETNQSNIEGLTGGFDDPFELELKDENADDDRHVYIYDEAGNGKDDVTLLFRDESSVGGFEKCSYQHEQAVAHIDLANREINGTTCSAFDRLDLPDDEVDDKRIKLRFENGDQAVGTYDIVVANAADVDESGDDHVWDNEFGPKSNNGAAFATAIIYDADVTITYESTDVSYQTTVRIAPEEIR
jgi:hypothetical protein